jgi:hypothetical protein
MVWTGTMHRKRKYVEYRCILADEVKDVQRRNGL